MIISDGPILVCEWKENKSKLLAHIGVIHGKIILKYLEKIKP